jgi:hypothetical protein
MTPYVQQSRTTQEQQEQRREEQSFEHVAAPALSNGLEVAAFGPVAAAVKALFKIAPMVFEGMSIPDGTNFPSPKNLFVNELIARQVELLKAA